MADDATEQRAGHDDWWNAEPDHYFEDEDDDLGDECGRWWGGRMLPWSDCWLAGTEFCDFECPHGSAARAVLRSEEEA